MPEPHGMNDVAPPEGYVFLVDTVAGVGHLSPADEPDLPVCRGTAEKLAGYSNLPHRFAPCPQCLRLVEEASSRPI